MVKFLDLKKVNDSFQPELDKAILRVVHSGWYTKGEELERFESEFALFMGTKFAVGVANGLDALRLILWGYIELGKLREGDEVIVPANTFIASILAITECRLKPVLVEPDINTFNLDPTQATKQMSPRVKAIMLVHLYGRNAMSPEIERLVKLNGLILIEDNAQAIGCTYQGVRTGAIGHSAGHSFYPGKNLGALGDAGAVTTNDAELAEIVRTLGNYGSLKKYEHGRKGTNSRLDDIQAAVLRLKLRRLDDDNLRRQRIAAQYQSGITSQAVVLPAPSNDHVWHLYVVRSNRRDKLQKWLTEQSIQTLVHYPLAPHKQGAFAEWHDMPLPVTEQIHREVLSLPMSPVMEDVEVDQVVSAVNAF